MAILHPPERGTGPALVVSFAATARLLSQRRPAV